MQSKPIKYLLIKLLQIQITQSDPQASKTPSYLSLSIDTNEQHYFSSNLPKTSSTLSDDIIINLKKSIIGTNIGYIGQRLDFVQLQLHRWENHMIMFTHQVGLLELKTRNMIMKRIQTRSGEVLKMYVTALAEEQVMIGHKYIESITQHYLIIQSISLHPPKPSNQKPTSQPSYIQIKTSPPPPSQSLNFSLPVSNAQTLIKLPQTLQFFYVKDGHQVSKSRVYTSSQITSHETVIGLSAIAGGNDSKIRMVVSWGINLSEPRPENILLLDSQEVMIYDIEVKFDNFNEYGGSKVKFMSGNKAFQIGSDFNSVKPPKIRKIINFITKSQDEQFYIIVEKNVKVVAQCKVHIQQITPFSLCNIKKKIVDQAGKPLGLIKFRCQRAKNLSTPVNNKAWRQSLKNKNTGLTTFIFDQITVRYSQQIPLILNLKTEIQSKNVRNLTNLQFYDQDSGHVSTPISMNLKSQDSIYMIIKQDTGQDFDQNEDFIGIALFNPTTCRFGLNCHQLKFYKNQQHTLTLNCQINKIAAYPFIKPSFQPQLLQYLSHKNISLSIVMRQVYFTPYFYTYQYDNKNQAYSIVEISRVKKVLILENKNNQLSFKCSASSDNLDFNVQQTETIRIKITFLVSDIGQDQQIYGWALVKVKTSQLQASGTGLKFYLIEVKNQYGNLVGQINIQVHKAALFNSYEKQSRDILQSGTKGIQNDKRRLKMHLGQISQSMQMKQKSSLIQKKQASSLSIRKKGTTNPLTPYVKMPSNRYQNKIQSSSFSSDTRKRNNSVMGVQNPVKLPSIRQQTASPRQQKSFNQLVHMMKIRKRSTKGHYQQNSMLQSYKANKFHNLSHIKPAHKPQLPTEPTHLKQKIQKQNPNLVRNMQILFPKKSAKMDKNVSFKQSVSVSVGDQEQKLRGLKSILKEISGDMGEIEPTVKNFGGGRNEDRGDELEDMNGPQWEGNQFVS